MASALLEAVRGLHLACPDLGPKPLLAKLREQQPDLGAGTKEVREALTAVKAEAEAAKATAESEAKAAAESEARAAAESEADKSAAAPPAADEGGAPSPAALSLACIGCARLPSDMDDEREKHPICGMCRDEKLPTTYLCGNGCPANPGAWDLHGVFHKKLRKVRKVREDGGVNQRRHREAAEESARTAAQSGDKHDELVAKGLRYASKEDWRSAGKAFREAIALRPDEPTAYLNLAGMLTNSGHYVEAAQRFLDAKERLPVGSERWSVATAMAFDMLKMEQCGEVAKPEWWNDEGLKALSARVVKAAPSDLGTNTMRAIVLSGASGTWKEGPRSAAEFEEAVTHYERAAALHTAPAGKATLISVAKECRSHVNSM